MGTYIIHDWQGEPGKYFIWPTQHKMRHFRRHNSANVYTALLLSCNEKGMAHVSKAELARLCATSMATVDKSLKHMAKLGIITIFAEEYTPPSRAISNEQRWAIFKRDKYACRYCGKDEGPFEIDHIIPVIAGGATEEPNLVTACPSCNRHKSGRTPEEAGMELRAI